MMLTREKYPQQLNPFPPVRVC